MKRYSKQWYEIMDLPGKGDFDIFDAVRDLKPDEYRAIGCDGLLFVALGRDAEGQIVVLSPTGENGAIEFISYVELVAHIRILQSKSRTGFVEYSN